MKVLQPYSEYRDSGVEWLGQIPTAWRLSKLAHAFPDMGSGTTPPSDSDKWYGGTMPWITTGELREREVLSTSKMVTPAALAQFSALRVFPKGSVAIAMYGATIGRLGILGVEATTNQACCVLPSSIVVDNKYLYYWFQAVRDDIINLASGGGQPNISQTVVASLRVSCPPERGDQTQIAKFLDYETARIDALIDKQQQLIALLKEKRQAVISHAVTKGLDPNAPMKDSGVEWLGKVPAHWKVHCLRYCAADGNKNFTDGDWIESPFITDKGVRLLQTGNVGIGEFREKGFRYVSEETFSQLNCTEISPNDVLVCRLDGPVGRACLVPDLGVKMITSVDNAIVKPSDDFDARFLVYMMTSTEWISWIENICRAGGGFRFRISRSMLGNQRVPVPPMEEQRQIADKLDEGREMYEKLILRAEEATLLLQERRTALISAAVTGKIDVRDWKAPESDKELV